MVFTRSKSCKKEEEAEEAELEERLYLLYHPL